MVVLLLYVLFDVRFLVVVGGVEYILLLRFKILSYKLVSLFLLDSGGVGLAEFGAGALVEGVLVDGFVCSLKLDNGNCLKYSINTIDVL